MAHTFATSEACQASEFVGAAASSSRPLAATLRSVLDALWEGLAAHHKYEQLRSRGIAHATALRRAFGAT
jgi:hypothetical protein